MKRQVGFTVGELLIAISIILLIGALLFPVMRYAKEAGTRTACASNLRQLHAAIKMYEDSYDAPPMNTRQLLAYQPDVKPILLCPKDWTNGTLFPGSGDYRVRPDLRDKYPPTSYEFYYLIEWNAFLYLSYLEQLGLWHGPRIQMDRSDPNKAVAVCLWHEKLRERKGSVRDDILVQAVFNDGHIGWYDTSQVPEWTKDLPRKPIIEAR